jgi:Rrf2 family protein
MFSKACEYAIRATIYVGEQSLRGERASLKAIARKIGSPEAFTAKIMQQLVRKEILYSVMGPTGGFQMDEPGTGKIKLSMVVNAIDGDAIYRGCGLGLPQCDASHPCPVHDKFAKIRDDLQEMLEGTSIHELAAGLETGLTFLKR